MAVKPGESFTYTLEYMNVGTDDSGPITLGTSPPDVTFISASDGGAATAPSSPLASPW